MVLFSVIIGDPGVGTAFPANFCRFSGTAVSDCCPRSRIQLSVLFKICSYFVILFLR